MNISMNASQFMNNICVSSFSQFLQIDSINSKDIYLKFNSMKKLLNNLHPNLHTENKIISYFPCENSSILFINFLWEYASNLRVEYFFRKRTLVTVSNNKLKLIKIVLLKYFYRNADHFIYFTVVQNLFSCFG